MNFKLDKPVHMKSTDGSQIWLDWLYNETKKPTSLENKKSHIWDRNPIIMGKGKGNPIIVIIFECIFYEEMLLIREPSQTWIIKNPPLALSNALAPYVFDVTPQLNKIENKFLTNLI